MPSEGDAGLDYACPNCGEPVDPEWAACPACGVEFLPPEGESAPATAAGKKQSQHDDDLADLDKEFNEEFAKPPAKAAGKDDLASLQKEIKGELGKVKGKAPARPAKGAAPPPRTKGMAPPPPPKKGAPPSKGKPPKGKAPAGAPRPGGILGLLGPVLLLGGIVGVIVVANWDILIAGASQNTVGTLQLAGIIGAAAVAAVGLVLFLMSKRKDKKGAGAA